MSDELKSLEHRVLALEFLLDALIWGPNLEDKKYRTQVAQNLYMCVDASRRHNAHPVEVQNYLLRQADALAEIDTSPEFVKSALRPMIDANKLDK